MVDVLLNTDDIVVFGPPEVVDVLVDIGPQGTRGSKVFAGIGEPNANPGNIPETPLLNDLYIDISATGGSYMYQYVAEISGNTWIQILKLSPALLAQNYSITFTTGAGSQNIPITSISTDINLSTVTADQFNVQYNIENTLPVASAVAKSIVTISDVKYLKLDFTGVSFSGGTATNLSGEKTVQVLVSVVGG